MNSTQKQLAPLTEQDDDVTDELREILDGLSIPQKTISSKFFYDERGSRLFDQITRLPEYYPTRTELAILRDNIADIARAIGPQASLIEFGSGSNVKVRILLENMDRPAAYVPVDISKDYLVKSAQEAAQEFRGIEVLPVVADFMHPFELPNPRVMPLRNIVFFPGSTIGNLTHIAALKLLRVMHHEAGKDGALLIGIDLRKDRSIIERAYNDEAGVTAEFNLNVLKRINREFGADFDLTRFQHRAIYCEEMGRIEMYLVSLAEQTVKIGSQEICFREGESILTEYSHKYTVEGFSAMAKRVGFQPHRCWTDRDDLFAVLYFRRD
ncbi:MAG: L-histidine N(alpha)-methyltransferase [Woeseiaceae bacterium]|nr:L-histidine N(alpha)-methyltransferase [Woeseiaceae bacterium]